jgi:putative restriction endonuclease
MGTDPNAADNRWLREAFENRVPIICFLGVAPGRYQAFLPVFITGWDAKALKADIAFGLPEARELAPPQNDIERRYALRVVKQRLSGCWRIGWARREGRICTASRARTHFVRRG